MSKTYQEILNQPNKNWSEDSGQENGNYINICFKCKEEFIGNKHRVICKECTTKPKTDTKNE